MRIISGRLGGRRFSPPAQMPHTRPTTDVAKEGLFNILQNRIDFNNLKCLDLFAGTGSISYELASRGADSLTLVEKDGKQVQFIQQTAKLLGLTDFSVLKQDVFQFLKHCNEQFDFIFAGPPYALGNIEELPEVIFKQELLLPNGWFVLEHTPRNDFKNTPFYKTERKYGTTIFSIFINRPD